MKTKKKLVYLYIFAEIPLISFNQSAEFRNLDQQYLGVTMRKIINQKRNQIFVLKKYLHRKTMEIEESKVYLEDSEQEIEQSDSEAGKIINREYYLTHFQIKQAQEEDSAAQIPKKRISKIQLFGRIQKFDGYEFLTGSTPIVFLIEYSSVIHHLAGYYNEELRECLEICRQSSSKTADIISKVKVPSIFLEETQIEKVFMSIMACPLDLKEKYRIKRQQASFIPNRLSFIQEQYNQDFGQNEFSVFINKKNKVELKYQQLLSSDRVPLAPRTKKIGISKQRLNNLYIVEFIDLLNLNYFKKYY